MENKAGIVTVQVVLESKVVQAARDSLQAEHGGGKRPRRSLESVMAKINQQGI